MADTPQTFANHARLVPGYHYVTAPLVLVYLLWSAWRVIDAPSADRAHALVGALALLGVYAYTRLFPLRAQDRVIRLEERLRLRALLPADLQPHIDGIRPAHLIALRFAPDDEVEALVRAVLADPAMPPKAVKAQVRRWRADHFRV